MTNAHPGALTPPEPEPYTGPLGMAGRMAQAFIDSRLTPLLVVASLLLGVFAIVATPREEEPQIIVPMMDVFVQMPGASAKEVEERVTIPMEKKLMEIPGVEYVYSTTSPGLSFAVVRYKVGEDEEKSIVKLYNKMYANFDLIPPGASTPLIKPRSIDDVPILALTLWSDRVDGYMLRRIAAQLDDQIKDIPDVSETRLLGGERRQVRVLLDPVRLAAYRLAPATVAGALTATNREIRAGSFSSGQSGGLGGHRPFSGARRRRWARGRGAAGGRPVYLRDVASIVDGPEEPRSYVLFGVGKAAHARAIPSHSTPGLGTRPAGQDYPAVTISVAKRKGTNAIVIADKVLTKVESLKGVLIPREVQVSVTRNYGETAQEKSNELLKHLLLATLSVDDPDRAVPGLAHPPSWSCGRAGDAGPHAAPLLSVRLHAEPGHPLCAYLFHRHPGGRRHRGGGEHLPPLPPAREPRPALVADVAVEAVDEVGNPDDPGHLGRHRRHPADGFRGRPDGSLHAADPGRRLRGHALLPLHRFRDLSLGGHPPVEGREDRRARAESTKDWTHAALPPLMTPLIRCTWQALGVPGRRRRYFCCCRVLGIRSKFVHVKMLPFDNKSEFQVIVDMPEGTTLEQTARVTREIGQHLATVPEVTNYQIYAGTASPLQLQRAGPPLLPAPAAQPGRHPGEPAAEGRAHRAEPRHRQARAAGHPGHRRAIRRSAKVAEVPPGPPVLQTLVAEVYGPD